MEPNDPKPTKGITRRDALKLSGLAVGGLAIGSTMIGSSVENATAAEACLPVQPCSP